VPPEYVFNAGLGDLFVIRTAGEVIDRSILATVEYGAEHLHIPLLVVMGHESCGAVKAAAESKSAAPSPSLDYLLKAIQAARKPATQERDEIKTLVLANVEQVINDAMGKSTTARGAGARGDADRTARGSGGRRCRSAASGGSRSREAQRASVRTANADAVSACPSGCAGTTV
jgi:hypothetical protein